MTASLALAYRMVAESATARSLVGPRMLSRRRRMVDAKITSPYWFGPSAPHPSRARPGLSVPTVPPCLIVNELTANGVMEPARLYESPYTDHAPTGPESVFPEADVDTIVDILNTVKANALPIDGAA